MLLLLPLAILYIPVTMVAAAFITDDGQRNALHSWVNSRRSEEARGTAVFLLALFWPLWSPFYLVRGAVSGAWQGSKYLARGVRDLLPERDQPQLPPAKVHRDL